jgi:hypothetical protein
MHVTCPAYLILLDLINQIIFGEEYTNLEAPHYVVFSTPITSSLLGSAPYFPTPSAYVPPSM